MNEMTTRERFQAIMNFKPFDRLPILEWAGWWSETTDRWYKEGLPAGLADYDINRHFGLDIYKQEWFRPYGDCPRGETREERQKGMLGTMQEYEKIRALMYPTPAVNHDRWTELAAQQERGDIVLWFTLNGFFWFPREVLGIEGHLYAFYDEARLMHRINADLAEWNIKVIEEICSICRPDFMTFAEDMSYNHGPMLSKDLFDEFIKPYYNRVIPKLKEYGIISLVDSDGDISVPAYWFEEAGLDGILPLERQAGVDIADLRADHAAMRFIGHFDKMTMNKGESVMRAEFQRLLSTAAEGGFIISCDHQTPPGVSYKDYQLYVSLFREYADEAGSMSMDR